MIPDGKYKTRKRISEKAVYFVKNKARVRFGG
jgi:hypothetical protein